MKFTHMIALSGLCFVLACPTVGWTTSPTNQCGIAMANQKTPDIALTFMVSSDGLSSLAAQNSLYVFFKVPQNAMSTLASSSYSAFATLILHVQQATINQLENATTGMQLNGINYIVLDLSKIPAISLGSLLIDKASMPTAIEWSKQLTVVQASILDREFVVLAFDKNDQGTTSSFSQAPNWPSAEHLKILFKSQVYQS